MNTNIAILGIELSTNNCSVALLYNGKIEEISVPSTIVRSEKILFIINQLLEKTDITIEQLTALAFGAGPGSFTGLKIASCIMQGFHLAWHKPIIKISTLWALALQGYQQFGVNYIIPCIDAKMGQIYYGIYHGIEGVPLAIQKDALVDPREVRIVNQYSVLVVGDGIDILKKHLLLNLDQEVQIQYSLQYVKASSIVKLAEYCYNKDNSIIFNNDAEPIYLKLYD